MRGGTVKHGTILLLDAGYRPLRVITARRAVGLMLKGRAEGVTDESVVLRSASDAIEIPLVLRLGYSVNLPFRRDEVRATRRGIMARDSYTCQFVVNGRECERTATTIDHIHPKSKGGDKMSWTNIVASCEPHNTKKASKTMQELDWTLKREPFAPKAQMRLLGAGATVPAAWAPFLSYAS